MDLWHHEVKHTESSKGIHLKNTRSYYMPVLNGISEIGHSACSLVTCNFN